jgi:hypothetical protein
MTKEELYAYGWERSRAINYDNTPYEVDKTAYKAHVCTAINDGTATTFQHVNALIDDLKYIPVPEPDESDESILTSFDDIMTQYEQRKDEITLIDTLTEIAAQLKRIADAMENKTIDAGDLPF